MGANNNLILRSWMIRKGTPILAPERSRVTNYVSLDD